MVRDIILKSEQILNQYLVERRDEIRGLNLGLYSGNNVMLLGMPGVAKSMLINYWASLIEGAEKFSWLMTKFTTPEEIFGPYNLPALKEGRFTRMYKGKLPSAHIAFLDEIWKSNSGILNSILSLLNEHSFFDDGVAKPTPTLMVVAASNELPDDSDGLAAIQDRFVLKFMVKPIQETANFIKMLETEMPKSLDPIISLDMVNQAREEVKQVKLGPMTDLLAKIRVKLQQEGFDATVRTFKASVNIIKAQAYLQGRDEVVEDDLDVLQHILWTDPDTKKKIYTHVLDLINPVRNKIIELFDDASEIYNGLVETKDKDAKIKKCAEVTDKLRAIKTSLCEYEELLTAQNKNTADIHQMQDTLDNWLGDVFEIITGSRMHVKRR